MVIQLTHVGVVRRGERILDDVNWQVQEGEHWGILGLNGSGKTMLLNLLTGYARPSCGEVVVLGQKFGHYDWREMRKKLGLVSYSLLEKFHLVERVEDIILGGKDATIGFVGPPQPADRDRAADLLAKFGCSALARRDFGQLSQGEKQKILIIRALMAQPRILLLDEPCTGLDILAREHLLQLIEQLALEPAAPTLIYVTHHVEELLPVFTHSLLLKEGRVFAQGPIDQIISSATLESFFPERVQVTWREGRPWLHLRNRVPSSG